MTAPLVEVSCAANVYLRMMHFVNEGDVEQGHQHEFDHFTLLANGALRVRIPADGVDKEYWAPAMIFIDKNKIHELTSLVPNTVAACIHALRFGEAVEDIIPFESRPEMPSRPVARPSKPQGSSAPPV